MVLEINRRAVLHSAALAAGALALGGLRSDPAGASIGGDVTGVPVAGPVIAWLRFDTAGRAALRVAELDAASRPARDIASGDWTVDSVAGALREANTKALDAVARSWGVAPGSCRIEAGRIVQADGGRAASYAVWTDFA